MSYRIEICADRVGGVHLEFEIRDADTRGLLPGYQVDHRLVSISGFNYGYANDGAWSRCIIASNENGLISSPYPGVQIMDIPGTQFGWSGYCDDYGFNRSRRRTVDCQFLAWTDDVRYRRKLADVTIYFGAPIMTAPRIQILANPSYPMLPPEVVVPALTQVSQIKIQLKMQGSYDSVEQSLGPPTNPDTITWSSGGFVVQGGPLSNTIKTALGYNDAQMALFLQSAALNVI